MPLENVTGFRFRKHEVTSTGERMQPTHTTSCWVLEAVLKDKRVINITHSHTTTAGGTDCAPALWKQELKVKVSLPPISTVTWSPPVGACAAVLP